jgi:hypothetical protein
MRVTLVDPDEDVPEGAAYSPGVPTLVPEVSAVPAAPPLAVRPVDDAEWTFHD